jgi:hypothetical protein
MLSLCFLNSKQNNTPLPNNSSTPHPYSTLLLPLD